MEDAAGLPALLLPLGDDLYALELAEVDQVLVPGPPTPLPEALPAVLGVINVRGQVVAVLDLGVLLGLAPVGLDAIAAVVVVRLARGPAALAVSAMPWTLGLGEPLGPSALPVARERRRAGGAVATLLDLEATAGAERVAA